MRLAVISDIHGNLEAFESVLQDIRSRQVESVISLGDNIGYGADSERVVQRVREQGILSILGNHELAVNDVRVRKWFRKDAQKALKQVLASLSEDSKNFIRELKINHAWNDCLFVHGFPPDSARFYLFQISDAKLFQTFQNMEASVCFVGHTHRLRLLFPDGDAICSRTLPEGYTRLDRDRKYIINAGSVGQPRDGEPQAKYIIWDSAAWELEVRFVPYDIETAAHKILEAGIPEQYAAWLKGPLS